MILFQGFFQKNETLKLSNPVIDPLGVAIFKCFPGLPLEYGLFLLHTAANGCLLSGMIYIACYKTKQSLLKKKGCELHAQRQDLDLMDQYRLWTISTKSNAEIYNEIALKYVYTYFYLYLHVVIYSMWLAHSGFANKCYPRDNFHVTMPIQYYLLTNMDTVYEVYFTFIFITISSFRSFEKCVLL